MLRPISAALCLLLIAQPALAQEPGAPRNLPDSQLPTPPKAPLPPGDRVFLPPGAQADLKPYRVKRKGLVIGGAITLGVSYLITPVLTGVAYLSSLGFCESCPEALGLSLIPIFGPGIALRGALDDSPTLLAYAILIGVAQTAGLGMLIAGLVGKKVTPKPPTYAVVPMLVPSTQTRAGVQGAAFSMRF